MASTNPHSDKDYKDLRGRCAIDARQFPAFIAVLSICKMPMELVERPERLVAAKTMHTRGRILSHRHLPIASHAKEVLVDRTDRSVLNLVLHWLWGVVERVPAELASDTILVVDVVVGHAYHIQWTQACPSWRAGQTSVLYPLSPVSVEMPCRCQMKKLLLIVI